MLSEQERAEILDAARAAHDADPPPPLTPAQYDLLNTVTRPARLQLAAERAAER